jgi:hypothetical protein
MQQPQTHRGLKHTERKPLGHLYLSVTHTTMSSAVHILTQVKAWTGIMAVVLYTAASEVTVSSVS